MASADLTLSYKRKGRRFCPHFSNVDFSKNPNKIGKYDLKNIQARGKQFQKITRKFKIRYFKLHFIIIKLVI